MADNALTLTGNSTQTSIVNGSFSRSHTLTYSVRPKRQGAVLQIPAFTVETNKGTKQVAAYTGGAARVVSDDTINSRLMPGAATMWAGEVFPITYVINGARRNFSQLASTIDWNSAPLIVEGWPQNPESAEMILNGEPRMNVVYRTRGYAKAPGQFLLNPTTQLVNLVTGSIGFGLFQQQRVEQLAVSSKRPEITVKPLPTPPPGFSGAVGQFTLNSKVVPTTAAVGEPVTWTLELGGTGNWPDIAGLPQREVSKDFQVVQPQAKRTPAEGKLFDVTLAEDVVLVPTRPGSYTLNPVSFIYFDPKAGEYKTLTTPRTAITITPAAAVNGAPRFQVGVADATPEATADKLAPKPTVTAPPPPGTLPRGPLTGSGNSPVPMTDSRLAILAAAPLVLFVLFWAWLAIQRARLSDPVRARREARARMSATLARLANASALERPQLILAWQHDAAILWELRHAAPPPVALPDETWRQLWTESDRTLYRADTPLPSDWVARAQAAIVAKRVPGFSPFSALRGRNLAPFLMLAVVALLLPSLRAEDAIAAYNRGEFAAAEKIWTADVAHSPTNPIARHNLSLALAQQDRWDLSLAHATAALVQSPSSEPIRWQFALAGDKAGFLPAPLIAFPKSGPVQALAQLASPGGWQRWLIVASIIFAFSCGASLYSSYRRRSTLRTGLALFGFAVSVLLAGSALVAIHAYGQTADARAVIVWRGSVLRSIPTESDTTQKTTTLAAGSVAVVDGTFLTWVRLSFDNGQTGWVRKDDTIALWH